MVYQGFGTFARLTNHTYYRYNTITKEPDYSAEMCTISSRRCESDFEQNVLILEMFQIIKQLIYLNYELLLDFCSLFIWSLYLKLSFQ